MKDRFKVNSLSWPIYILVSTVSLTFYLNGLRGDFVHDDIPAIVRNKDVLGETSLLEILHNDFWGVPIADVCSHKSYRPLTTITFRINHWLFGLNAFWFHVTNVILHVCASILFTKTCLDLVLLEAPFAALAGLLFAVHPVHTEAVTGIVGRADILASVLFLISILIYHRSLMKNHRWLALLTGGLSMFAKETGITVFLVNFLFDLYKSWRFLNTTFTDLQYKNKIKQFVKRSILNALVFTILILLRVGLLHGSLPTFSDQDNPAAFHPSSLVRIMTYWYLMAFNWWLLLCPAMLSHDWQMGSIPLVTNILDSRNLFTCFFLLLIICLIIKGVAEFRYQENASAVLGIVLLIVPFLPATNLVLTVGFVIAERILYIPSMGFILLIVNGVRGLWKHDRHRQTVLSLLLIVLLSHSLRCVIRNRDWHSRETLLRAGIATLPHNAKMHYNYGNFLKDSGRTEFAILHYHTALRLWPSYASAHNNLGTLLKNEKQAENHFLKAIHFSKNHINAYYNLGRLYLKMNKTKDSVFMFRKCLKISTNFEAALLVLVKVDNYYEYSSDVIGTLSKNLKDDKRDYLQLICSYEYLQLQKDNLRKIAG